MSGFRRHDGRAPEETRPIRIHRRYLDFAEGSCLVEFGRTRVACAATVEQRTPSWLLGTGRGWVTAEYAMLPRSTPQRSERESNRGRPSGRTQEIQRLIGRSLRAAVDLEAMSEVTIVVDCDCLVADGGTRTAAITGGYVALVDALRGLQEGGRFARLPVREPVAAVSAGLIAGMPCLDLDYEEDSQAEVDMNVVMTASGRLVEVQGTAEAEPFERALLDRLIDLAALGVRELTTVQETALSE